MKNHFILLSLLFFVCSFISCEKNNVPNEAGGDLPTNYIYITNSGLHPNQLQLASGNSVTFVNQTNNSQLIYTADSTIKNTIAPHKSFYWEKDTTGTFTVFVKGTSFYSTINLAP